VQLTVFDDTPIEPAKGRPLADGAKRLLRALDGIGLKPEARLAAAGLVLELDRNAKGRDKTRPDAQKNPIPTKGVAAG
jgi:hypothetical protein